MNAYLIEKGFTGMEADPCRYIREVVVDVNSVKKTQYQLVALYVNDLIFAAFTKHLVTDLEGVFESRFKMKKLHQIKQIPGMGIYHDKNRNIIYITQQQYIEEFIKAFSKYGISEYRTPMDDRARYSWSQMPKPGSAEALLVATFPYRELIGTLLWISNGTRPDIVFVVNTLAKFTSNPGPVHWRAALRELRFLQTTKHYCIRYAQQHFNENITLSGYMRGRLPITPNLQSYVDASHAEDVDTRRSTTGYILFASGEPVSWQCRMQTTVALSSMEE
jgi:Reverse transcriptase (RNA-dependent DNA polymerase)